MVDLHGLHVDMWFQSIGSIGEFWKGVRHIGRVVVGFCRMECTKIINQLRGPFNLLPLRPLSPKKVKQK